MNSTKPVPAAPQPESDPGRSQERGFRGPVAQSMAEHEVTIVVRDEKIHNLMTTTLKSAAE
ncbi:MAG: hypothetical protein ACX93P_03515 [Roseovarius sp.]